MDQRSSSMTAPQPVPLRDCVYSMIFWLVDYPDKIEIKETVGEKAIIYEIKVDDRDAGRVIGKMGHMIESLRFVMRGVAAKQDKKISIELLNGNHYK